MTPIEYLQTIQPADNIPHFLSVLSSGLFNNSNKTYLHVGLGSNGKTLLFSLLRKALLHYPSDISHIIFSAEDEDGIQFDLLDRTKTNHITTNIVPDNVPNDVEIILYPYQFVQNPVHEYQKQTNFYLYNELTSSDLFSHGLYDLMKNSSQ